MHNSTVNGGVQLQSCGGASAFEAGGPGTGFVWSETENHRALIIDNCGGEPIWRKNHLHRWVSAIEMESYTGHEYTYNDLSEDGGHAWILEESGTHQFAGYNYSYHFEELQMYGHGHLAFLTDPPYAHAVDIYSDFFIGDRTGTLHLGGNQTMDLEREEISLPFNLWAYNNSHAGLAYSTDVHGVFIQMSGRLSHVHNMTIHREGDFWANHGGRTTGSPPSHYKFDYITIANAGQFHMETHPVRDPGIYIETIATYIEGGAEMRGAKVIFISEDLFIDDGGTLNGDELGYHVRHGTGSSQHGEVNRGQGIESADGASGAGHGGSAGRGKGTPLVGQAYDDIYEPRYFGSAGGTGAKEDEEHGGRGGGIWWMNITSHLHIDGLVSSRGGAALEKYSGGGSGGAIWMHCKRLSGSGNITAHGGDGYFHVDDAYLHPIIPNKSGGGGGGGRIALYLQSNNTFVGRMFAAGGASLSEPGGPGTVFIYHLVHTHRTLIVDNDGQPPNLPYIKDYHDLSEDSPRAWILSESGYHDFALNNHSFYFEELQIYGSAHLAFVSEPEDLEIDIFYRHMIGDRTGVIHLGNNQTCDLQRSYLDQPFSAYVYEGGYFGMGHFTDLDGVFVVVGGRIDHVTNLTLIHGATLYMNLTGATEGSPDMTFEFHNTVTVKDESSIWAHQPLAYDDPFILKAHGVVFEGGALMDATFMRFETDYFTMDDGSVINATSRGHDANTGPGAGVENLRGHSGAGHGGRGGRGGGRGSFEYWELAKGAPYGSIYNATSYGSGGGGEYGSPGGGRLEFYVTGIMHIDGDIMVDAYDINQVFRVDVEHEFPIVPDHPNLSMNTRSDVGGGYMPALREFWYTSYYSSSIYRYDDDGNYLGSHGIGVSYVRQIEGDVLDFYYVATESYI
jgi:hypothetical protein